MSAFFVFDLRLLYKTHILCQISTAMTKNLNHPSDSFSDLPAHITEQIGNLERIVARRIDSVEGEAREQITHVIGSILNMAADKIGRLDMDSGENIRPRVVHCSGDMVSGEIFERARGEFQSIVGAMTAQGRLTDKQKRSLEIVRSGVFGGRTNKELMGELSLAASGVKVSKSRGINLIWKSASEDLRRILLGARPAEPGA